MRLQKPGVTRQKMVKSSSLPSLSLTSISSSKKLEDQLKLINELSLMIQSLIDSESLYQELVDIIQRKFHYYSLSIWIIDDEGSATLEAQSGAYNEFLKIGFKVKGEGIVSTVATTGRTYLCNDVLLDSHFTKLSLPVATRSQLSIPIRVDGAVTAVLTIESQNVQAFDVYDKICFESLGIQLGIALTNAKLFQRGKSFNSKLKSIVEQKTAELREANRLILEQQKLLKRENRALKDFLEQEIEEDGSLIVGSPTMRQILQVIDQVAQTDSPVLIIGEPGTGKEVVARRIHLKSRKRSDPYIPILCKYYNDPEFLNEITKEIQDPSPKTLYFDDISGLSLHCQEILFKLIQDIQGKNTGKQGSPGVRILCSSTKELEPLIQQKKFFDPLYYALNTMTINLPPLRKRPEDLRVLFNYFLNSTKAGLRPYQVDESVYEILESYDWPGNISELQQIVERTKLFCEGPIIKPEDIPLHIRMPHFKSHHSSQDTLKEFTLEDLEKQHILKTLNFFKNNKTKAAHSLGITIKTLYNKLHRYGLKKDDSEAPPVSSVMQ